MSIVKVKIKNKLNNSYKVFIKKNCLDELCRFLEKEKLGQKYAVITDETTGKIFGKSFISKLKKEKIDAQIFSFKSGEKSKNLNTIENLAEKMVESEFGRKDAIIALGGGVVGDMAGFLAAIYLRGIPYLQVPTTLLAMVDSSIGGKTGVDLKSGKNLIGTFNQPKVVFVDTKFLETLPEKQIRSGLAEIIKCGVIADEKLFHFIEQNHEKIFKLEENSINYIIKRSIEIKRNIVQSDEKEAKKRMLLNYGHTYGHALEKMSNYTLLHGYAISIGMVIINDIGVKKGILKKQDAERIKKLFKITGLPISTIKKPGNKELLSDKKREGNYINLVIPSKIGKAIIYKEKCQ